ncbi:hypothetical protein PAXRUDRAFT_18615 [Paxillus rubicundulus Ve08.2h10]|uniref:Uncharacterized protein n=1 Tax=Paxillus rubicundulus Ve08.2h10 TaxID=930991 RepID=A0A0D0D6S3_9AGAM|nr:hypothetical protein PAXRUDRAFT_18615 [Paxillus rubicundulus Ve08.2h10]
MSPLHVAVFVCLTTAFYATARTGELTTKTLRSFDPLSHIKPTDVRVDQDCQGNKITNLHLPKLKSTLNALENHMSVNAPPHDGPLFAY